MTPVFLEFCCKNPRPVDSKDLHADAYAKYLMKYLNLINLFPPLFYSFDNKNIKK